MCTTTTTNQRMRNNSVCGGNFSNFEMGRKIRNTSSPRCVICECRSLNWQSWVEVVGCDFYKEPDWWASEPESNWRINCFMFLLLGHWKSSPNRAIGRAILLIFSPPHVLLSQSHLRSSGQREGPWNVVQSIFHLNNFRTPILLLLQSVLFLNVSSKVLAGRLVSFMGWVWTWYGCLIGWLG